MVFKSRISSLLLLFGFFVVFGSSFIWVFTFPLLIVVVLVALFHRCTVPNLARGYAESEGISEQAQLGHHFVVGGGNVVGGGIVVGPVPIKTAIIPPLGSFFGFKSGISTLFLVLGPFAVFDAWFISIPSVDSWLPCSQMYCPKSGARLRISSRFLKSAELRIARMSRVLSLGNRLALILCALLASHLCT